MFLMRISFDSSSFFSSTHVNFLVKEDCPFRNIAWSLYRLLTFTRCSCLFFSFFLLFEELFESLRWFLFLTLENTEGVYSLYEAIFIMMYSIIMSVGWIGVCKCQLGLYLIFTKVVLRGVHIDTICRLFQGLLLYKENGIIFRLRSPEQGLLKRRIYFALQLCGKHYYYWYILNEYIYNIVLN